jgi:hypothetical protein
VAVLRARLDAVRHACRDQGGRAQLMRPVNDEDAGPVWAVPAETILAVIDPPDPSSEDDQGLPTAVRHLHQALRQAGTAGATLDPSAPTALTLIGLLHFVPDEHDPYQVVVRLVAGLPPGSYVALSHATLDPLCPDQRLQIQQLRATSPQPLYPRTRAQVERFFHGLELVEPVAFYSGMSTSCSGRRAEVGLGDPYPMRRIT